jgi:hypothetical protein
MKPGENHPMTAANQGAGTQQSCVHSCITNSSQALQILLAEVLQCSPLVPRHLFPSSTTRFAHLSRVSAASRVPRARNASV